MMDVRLAKEGEIDRQKEIWKLCFGDSDLYIDFYYANRYKEDETIILIHDDEISAMLTMISVKTIAPCNLSIDSVMFYAIATHPNYQKRGFATQLIEFSNQYIRANHKDLSILVPADKQLFNFYYKQGYRDGFYIRETQFTREMINSLTTGDLPQLIISPITPTEYNQRRSNQLNGKLFVAYADEEIAYQKRLSRLSGADIYGIESKEIKGCVAIERLNNDKIFIKEILLPENLLNGAIHLIAKQFYAEEYILRTPAFLGEQFGGSIRPFGIIKGPREINLRITPKDLGYLGFAFD